MQCSICGFDNGPGTSFCQNCGTRLETAGPPAAPTAFCPRCGSQVIPGTQFCSKCGQDLTGPVDRRAAPAAQPARPSPAVSPGAIVAGIGAILMLIALAVPWFTVRNGISANISIGDLLDTLSEQGPGDPLWAGMALPIILIIIAASIVLISVIYSVLARTTPKTLWRLMGTLVFFCVLGNAGYFLYWMHDTFDRVVNISAL